MQNNRHFMGSIKVIAGLFLSTVVAGCTIGKENVLFVTTTSLGVDFDSTPPMASVAYNRVEGYIGPRYENGAVPPVLARIQSDGSVFSAKVRQIYATGAAATIVANPLTLDGPKELKGNKKVMFFGTTTTTGLKVGFSGNLPDSFVLGYKRKELSFIPLGHDQSGKDAYPSVLATIDTTAHAGPDRTAGLQSGQFFATGEAADAYAKDPEIRAMFKNAATDAFQVYNESVTEQQKEVTRILRCYSGVKVTDLPEVWKDADEQGLLKEKDNLAKILEWYKAATAPGVEVSARDDNLRKAHKRYAGDIADLEGSNPQRITNMSKHREKVCAIASR